MGGTWSVSNDSAEGCEERMGRDEDRDEKFSGTKKMLMKSKKGE